MDIPNTEGDDHLAVFGPIEGPTTRGKFEVDENGIASR
jgi:hypothetical protein